MSRGGWLGGWGLPSLVSPAVEAVRAVISPALVAAVLLMACGSRYRLYCTVVNCCICVIPDGCGLDADCGLVCSDSVVCAGVLYVNAASVALGGGGFLGLVAEGVRCLLDGAALLICYELMFSAIFRNVPLIGGTLHHCHCLWFPASHIDPMGAFWIAFVYDGYCVLQYCTALFFVQRICLF